MADKSKVTWHQIELENANKATNAAHDAWKDAQAKATEARKELEKALRSELEKKNKVPDGFKPIFGFRFGKVAVAFVDEDDDTGTKSKGKNSIAL